MWGLFLDVLRWAQSASTLLASLWQRSRARARGLLGGPHDAWVWPDGRLFDATSVQVAAPAYEDEGGGEGGGCLHYSPVCHLVVPAKLPFAVAEGHAKPLPLLSCVAMRPDGAVPPVDLSEWVSTLRIVPPHAPTPAALLALFATAQGCYTGLVGWRLEVVGADGAARSVDARLRTAEDAETWAAVTAPRGRGLFGGGGGRT